MKEIEFQHFRKAPHPFQHYGNIPPAALKNRSMQQQHGALPQGQDAFVHKIGKKLFDLRHKSSIKQHWLGIENNDSLSEEVARYHHKVKGKSLQTKDIEGAQGGSLKPLAVKYKQKAQELKIQRMITSDDRQSREREEFRHRIENAIKSQHQNDKQIVKIISNKGYGHYLNPQNSSTLKNASKKKDKIPSQHYLKQKYSGFENKDQKQQQFFHDVKNKKDNYQKFFLQLNQQSNKQKIQDFSYRSIQTPKIQHKKSDSLEKYRTIETQNPNSLNEKNLLKLYEQWKQKQWLKSYQPQNFSKRSIESQFRYEIEKGVNLDSIQSDLPAKKQNKLIGSRTTRKQNPTNLSNPLGSTELKCDIKF